MSTNLYSIRDWDKLYENSRSRTVTDLAWVKVPNHHDGENYTAIMAHPQGAPIFSAWILLIQVASKCSPRGCLIKANKDPHTPLSLSLKTRAPQEWFEIALDYLSTHTDWLVVEEVTGDRQATVTCLSPACHPSAEGMEWKEGNGREVELPKNFPKSIEEANTQCMAMAADSEFIAVLWNGAMGRHGFDGAGQPIRSWKHYVAKHWPKEQARKFKDSNDHPEDDMLKNAL